MESENSLNYIQNLKLFTFLGSCFIFCDLHAFFSFSKYHPSFYATKDVVTDFENQSLQFNAGSGSLTKAVNKFGTSGFPFQVLVVISQQS